MLIINSQTQTVRQFARWTETLYTNDRPPLSSDHNFSRPFPFLPFIIVFTSTVFFRCIHTAQCSAWSSVSTLSISVTAKSLCNTNRETFESKFLCYSINSFLYWKNDKDSLTFSFVYSTCFAYCSFPYWRCNESIYIQFVRYLWTSAYIGQLSYNPFDSVENCDDYI